MFHRPKSSHASFRLWLSQVYPLVRYSLELCVKVWFGVAYAVLFCLYQGSIVSMDEMSKASGGSSVLAAAKVQKLRSEIIDMNDEEAAHRSNEVELELDLVSYRDMSSCCSCCIDKRMNTVTVKVGYTPPESTSQDRVEHRRTICQPDPKTRPINGYLRSTKGDKFKYAVRSGYDIIHQEELDYALKTMTEVYNADPLDPRGFSSIERPPVQKVKAIYGVNLPTECGTVFRRTKAVLGNAQHKVNYFKPDTDVTLKENDGDHIIKQGVIYECGTDTITSGDGTVPYWSLNHVKSWENDCDVTIHELDGAEHREILADKRLHRILVDYLCQKTDVTLRSNTTPE